MVGLVKTFFVILFAQFLTNSASGISVFMLKTNWKLVWNISVRVRFFFAGVPFMVRYQNAPGHNLMKCDVVLSYLP